MKNYKKHSISKSAGFSLLEIMVVLAIIGGIMGIVAVSVGGKQDQANIKTTKTKITIIEGAINTFRTDTKRYPNSLSELNTRPSDVKRWLGPYATGEDALLDAWNNEFQYRYPGQHKNFDLYSFGQDGREGGQDFDADITNWE